MLAIGPVLICVVFGLVGTQARAVFRDVLPAVGVEARTPVWCAHAALVGFLIVNGLFNYVKCVATNPGTHDSPVYKKLLAEARVMGHVNDGHAAAAAAADSAAAPMLVADGGGVARARGRYAEADREPPAAAAGRGAPGSWMDLGAFEWGYCKRTRVPKAPRAHYDHVTKKLVLNMDHYCPWMFNVVGCVEKALLLLLLLLLLLRPLLCCS